MTKPMRHTLKELRFVGGRFEENKGWLDLDILPELLKFKEILVETAKEEWRRRNPGRNLRQGFEKSIRLGFREIRDGSCAIPVERIVELEDDAIEMYVEDEVDEAVRIIDATLISARNDVPFPEGLSAKIIPMFGAWGKSLRSDEGIEIVGDEPGLRPRFDEIIRDRLLRARRKDYEDEVDLVGEVWMAGVKASEGGSFKILLKDGTFVTGGFTTEDESRITGALHNRKSVRLRVHGLGEFDSSGQLRRIVRIEHCEECPLGEQPFDPEAPPIWEVIAGIGESIPDEEWRKVPTDLALNLDHYLYGIPKEGGQ